MKKYLGIIFIVIGILMMVYTGFNYITKEKVVDLGPIVINAERSHSVKWPPIVGVVFIAGGIVAMALYKKARI